MPRVTELPREVVAAFHEKGFATPVLGVSGGKGGVGKTTVAVNLACALADRGLRVALIDADVDAPNAALLLDLALDHPSDVSATVPVVEAERCSGCGACVEACRRHALFMAKGKPPQLLGECNGCEACFLVCPEDALSRERRQVGTTYRTDAADLTLYTGELQPSAEESAEVVKELKARAFGEAGAYDCLIVDTAPGAHCNVLFALQGVDLVLAVTEPTPLGAHDLERILELLRFVALPGRVLLNRSDLPGTPEAIAAIAAKYGAPMIASLPVDSLWIESCAAGRPLVRLAPESEAAGLVAGLAERLAEEWRL